MGLVKNKTHVFSIKKVNVPNAVTVAVLLLKTSCSLGAHRHGCPVRLARFHGAGRGGGVGRGAAVFM